MRTLSLTIVLFGFTVAPDLAPAQNPAPSPAAAEADPLAELAALGDAVAASGPEAGGSIRAKRDVDPTLLQRQNDARNIEGKVETIKVGKFPTVALKVKVIKSAKQGPGKDIAKNSDVVIVPRLKVDGAKVSMDDAETVVNAGAFYLQAGDKVVVRLGQKKDKVWEAEYIERK